MATVFYENAAEVATLTNTFSVAGVATDPTTVSLTVTDPTGAATTYTYAAAQITKSATGVYTKEITCSLAGTWLYLWVGTGVASDAQAGTWTVLHVDLEQRYCSLEELKSRIGETGTTHDFELQLAIESATDSVETFCGRSFVRQLATETRLYYPTSDLIADLDDFHTTTGLVVATDTGNDGVYETTWLTTDYQLEPLNGVVDGQSGWPYNRIRAVGNERFPCVWRDSRAPLQVTAYWGWSAIPPNVKEACLILAEESFRLKDSPFGSGGYGQLGIIRVRDNPMAGRLLMRYQRYPVKVA